MKKQKNQKSWLRENRYYLIGALFILFLGALALVWRGYHGPSAGERPGVSPALGSGGKQARYVQVFRAQQVRFQDALESLTGTVRGSSLELKCTQEEKLLKYNYQPGDFVKKGGIIAELDHVRTRARYRQAQINLKRKQSLYDVGGAARMELEEAEETLNIAEKDYQDTFIRAPKNGYMGECRVQEGELTARQAPIVFFVSTDDPFFVETNIIEKRMPEIKVGQKAMVIIEAFPGVEIPCKVLSISPEVTTTSRMASVRIGIAREYRARIKPGLSTVCRIIIFDREVLLIPKNALLEKEESVYLVDEKNRVHVCPVETGYASRDYVEIRQGLNEGDVVVLRPEAVNLKKGLEISYGQVEEYGK